MTSRSLGQHLRHLAVAAGIALLLAGCGGSPEPAAGGDDTAAAAGVAGEVRATADRFLAAARDQLGLGAARPVPRQPPPAPPAARPAAPRPQPAAEPQPVEAATPPAEPPVAFVPVPPMPPAAAPEVERPPAPARPSDTALYSSGDHGVDPPAWRSPTVSVAQLAGSTGHVPALELIVGTDGTVERARLLHSSRQLPDMMILSSAKMWRFEPARLNGEPVRYRLVVRIDKEMVLE